MVVKMMRWRPWPPLVTKKCEVKLVVRRMEGWDLVREGVEKMEEERLAVEIRWKGPKLALSTLRRRVKRNFTREAQLNPSENESQNGVVLWDEEFQSLCTFSAYKENVFHPWEIGFRVFNISLSLLELRMAQDTTEPVQTAIVPVASPSLQSGESSPTEKDELSAIKAGLRKVKIFTEYVSTRKAKKACREEECSEGRCSARSEDGEYSYPFDSDSLEDFEEGESDEGKEEASVRKSFSYSPLAYANCARGSFDSSMRIYGEDEDWVYYSKCKSDAGCSHPEDPLVSVAEPSLLQSSKRSLLSWRKRKLSFRSPKSKGEPLLKKGYGEEGGDDIDFDRRQLSSDESFSYAILKTDDDLSANRSSVSEFGDDNFAIGSWEHKEIISRDGQMKLQSEVFFASIDQRSERAAGESACTALVAVIADWFQNNCGLMPIKSQFDSLIRDGSLEWRNLCENETYRERFPDKHFDLETVLQAKVRPLGVISGKSFVGFFHPEGMDEGRFDFLHGAMSFDNIWDEISCAGSESPRNDEPHIYIVSWNDHFFVLKIEPEAYYIIDTLGERLYEGCNQAYILKFDYNSVIHKLPNVCQSNDEKPVGDQQITASTSEPNNQPVQQVNAKEEGSISSEMVTKNKEPVKNEGVEEIVCRGKEACKEYIKSFLAAIPIRELQADIKKGLMASTPLHHRLQIEFHYTQFLQPRLETPALEQITATPESVEAPTTVAAE
ncbi:uncharacterized protein LOC123228110 isoform X2 [Mangifera indica]|uniref:uncharacterized protein LOC123228110 isoform X2 n=1 Tax=Mangifera indica TaxID=29780 RepID=UPI001CFA5498|nr:uncharacterized protein LOC123228110 isoform X2 [Mangifera indica]